MYSKRAQQNVSVYRVCRRKIMPLGVGADTAACRLARWEWRFSSAGDEGRATRSSSEFDMFASLIADREGGRRWQKHARAFIIMTTC